MTSVANPAIRKTNSNPGVGLLVFPFEPDGDEEVALTAETAEYVGSCVIWYPDQTGISVIVIYDVWLTLIYEFEDELSPNWLMKNAVNPLVIVLWTSK